MPPKMPHPSGRPIRPVVVKRRPIWRIPDQESNIPRLRETKRDVEAIGFMAQLVADDDPDL